MLINDERAIMYDYRRDYTFAPEALHAIDYHIEGKYGMSIPVNVLMNINKLTVIIQ